MMGRLERDQGQLFYSFCLDEAVPSDIVLARSLPCWTCPGCTLNWRPLIGEETLRPRWTEDIKAKLFGVMDFVSPAVCRRL